MLNRELEKQRARSFLPEPPKANHFRPILALVYRLRHVEYRNPLLLLIIIITSIVFTHAISATIPSIFSFRPRAGLVEMLQEALVGATLVFPILYMLLVRPLFHEINSRKQAESDLRHAHEQITKTNKILQAEIAERREVEKQLLVQSKALEAAANGIVITDMDGKIQWVNPAFTRMSGYTLHEIQDKDPSFLRTGHNHDDLYQELWTTIKQGNIWQGEMINLRKDGSQYIEEQTISPVMNEQNQITHFIAIKQDISERRRALEDLERANEALRRSHKEERKHRELAEGLAKASFDLSQTLDLDSVVNALLDHLHKLIPFDTSEVLLMDDENSFSVVMVRGEADHSCPLMNEKVTLQARDNPLIETLLHKRQSVLVTDTSVYPDFQKCTHRSIVKSWLAVPLLAGGRVLGLCGMGKKQPNYFTKEHVQIADALVSQAAVEIQNAWLFDQVRAGHERLLALSRRLVQVQEAERQAISRELHDEAGQTLASLVISLDLLGREAEHPEVVLSCIADLESSVNNLIETIHQIAVDLRPATLDHLGLEATLRQYVEAVRDKTNLEVQFGTLNLHERLSPNVEVALYRIVQESLTNIIRHANATQADVLLERRGDKIIAIIEDNGGGFDPVEALNGEHLGLYGLRERAEMLGGKLLVESAPGKGTTILVEVPYVTTDSNRR